MKQKKNPWWPLFLTNFFSVFNDNLIKWLVIFVGISWVSDDNHSTVISVASAMLVIPYILFSPLAGKLAKIYSKRKIMIYGKLAEIPIMLIAVFGFYWANLNVVMVAVLFMGMQSALFSPAKYGLIRDIRGVDGISFGTGSMEMLTFVGVLLGTVVAGFLADAYSLNWVAPILLLVAIVGWGMAYLIKAEESPPLIQKQRTLDFVSFIRKQYRLSKNFPGVNYAIFGLSMFWLIGSLIQMNIALHSPNVLGESDTTTGFIMSAAALGIAAGAILTGWLSGKKVHLGFVFMGSIGLGISMILLLVIQPSTLLFSVLIFITAFFAGFYKIPLNSFIQANVKGRLLGDVLGYLNIMVFMFILFSAGLFQGMNVLTKDNTLVVFAFIAACSLFVGLFFYVKVPGVKDDFNNIIRGKLDRS
jgi:acyl-[acyl-carrier-protein]-phospholipid O-acyltransferase/long-chain-fatty-acid--[acyl-carrier-protein] ligase